MASVEKGVVGCFELEATSLQGIDDLGFGAERNDDVIGEISRYEEYGAADVSISRLKEERTCVLRDKVSTYMPAIAKGEVSSRTRRPASNPSPMTCMAI